MKAPLRLYLALLILSCAVSFAPEPLYSQEPGVLSMADHAKVLEAILKNNAAIIKFMGEHGFYGEYAGPSGRQVLNAALQIGIDGSLKGTLETIFHMSYGTFDPLKEPEDARMFRSQILNKIEGSNSVSDMIEGLQNVEIPRGKKPYEVARNEIIDMLKQGDSTIYSVEWWNHNVFSSDPADEVTRAKIKKVILRDAVVF